MAFNMTFTMPTSAFGGLLGGAGGLNIEQLLMMRALLGRTPGTPDGGILPVAGSADDMEARIRRLNEALADELSRAREDTNMKFIQTLSRLKQAQHDVQELRDEVEAIKKKMQ